jgi:hypothetical protein
VIIPFVPEKGRERSYWRPVKRTWALLESNPRRNNPLKIHRNDGRWGSWTLVQLPLVYRIDKDGGQTGPAMAFRALGPFPSVTSTQFPEVGISDGCGSIGIAPQPIHWVGRMGVSSSRKGPNARR